MALPGRSGAPLPFLLCGLDVPFYANLVSGSLIGPLVPRGTKYCSLIGYPAYSRPILLVLLAVAVAVAY